MASDQTTEEPCRLLQLPGELRNYIYELVAALEENGTVNFWTARPPGAELLGLSRQISREAKGVVAQAALEYWSTSHFIADVSSPTDALSVLDRLGHERTSLITKMTIHDDPKMYDYTWKLEDRIWSFQHTNKSRWWSHLILDDQPTMSDRDRHWTEPIGRPVDGHKMSIYMINNQPQDRIDEVMRLYGTEMLTKWELKQVVVLCLQYCRVRL